MEEVRPNNLQYGKTIILRWMGGIQQAPVVSQEKLLE